MVFWRPFYPQYKMYMFAYADAKSWRKGYPPDTYRDIGDWIKKEAKRLNENKD